MSSVRNKNNPYFQKQYHIPLAKGNVTKEEILVDIPGVEPSTDTTAPTISSFTFDDATDTATVNVNEGGTLYWVIDGSATAPTGAEVKAGNGEDGAAADLSGSYAVTATENDDTIDDSTLADGTWHLHITVEDAAGNLSAVSAVSYTKDTTAPVLSSVSATAGDTQIDLDWSTDTGSGTARAVVVANGSTAPSDTQILAGQDSTGSAALADSGSITVTASGAQPTETFTGLTNGTAYDLHLAHDDGNGNVVTESVTNVTPAAASAVYSDDFTTDTSADYSTFTTKGGTITYNASENALDFDPVDDESFSGVSTELITVTNGVGYTITCDMENLKPAGGVGLVLDMIAGTAKAYNSGGEAYGGSSFIPNGTRDVVTISFTASSTDLFVGMRCRSVNSEAGLRVHSLTVEET